MNSTCGRSGQHLLDRTAKSDEKIRKCAVFFFIPLGRFGYLNCPVRLHDNPMGSVPQKVSKNQEVVAVFLLLARYLETS